MHPSEAYAGNARRRQAENEQAGRAYKAADQDAAAILLIYQGILGSLSACPDVATMWTDAQLRAIAAGVWSQLTS